MRRIGIVAFAVVASLALVTSVYSQAKQDPKTGLYRIEGVIQAIDADKEGMTVKDAGTDNVTWRVVYTKDTVFTWRNEDAKRDAVQVGRQVVCLGKIPDPEKEKTKLTAVRIDVRTK